MRDSSAGSILTTMQQDAPAATQAAAHAVQNAPLFDEGMVKLTARAIREVRHGYQIRLKLIAPTLRLPIASDIACTL